MRLSFFKSAVHGHAYSTGMLYWVGSVASSYCFKLFNILYLHSQMVKKPQYIIIIITLLTCQDTLAYRYMLIGDTK